jgi:hypothetical protein
MEVRRTDGVGHRRRLLVVRKQGFRQYDQKLGLHPPVRVDGLKA